VIAALASPHDLGHIRNQRSCTAECRRSFHMTPETAWRPSLNHGWTTTEPSTADDPRMSAGLSARYAENVLTAGFTATG